MVNVTTIDFDIIMEPSISFYNNLVDIENPVEDYIKDFSFIANIPANLDIYEYLTRFIIQSLENVTKVYFVSSHDSIINILKQIPHDEPIEVTNIDHHHDIGYELQSWILPLTTYNCGNWVKYAKDRKLIDTYTWIHNTKFDPVDPAGEHYLDNEIALENINLEKKSKDVDFLIICASYEWVPPIYHPLFQTWQTICEEIKGEEYRIDNF